MLIDTKFEVPTNIQNKVNVAVSYSAHELDSRALRFPHKFLEETGKKELDAIAEHFGEVVLCMTDYDEQSRDRRELLEGLVAHAYSNDMLVTADMWNLGGSKNSKSLTGGEGISLYGQGGGELCLCPGSGLPNLTDRMLGLVQDIGIQRMFWDEPALDCDHFEGSESERKTNNSEISFGFLDTYTKRAGDTYGISWNEACVRWRDTDKPEALLFAKDWAHRVASIPGVSQISVAPYPLHPHNTSQKSTDQVIDHVRPAYETVAEAARKQSKTARGWLQGFNYSEANIPVMDMCFDEVVSHIGNVAVWSHDGSLHDPSLNSSVSMCPEDIQKELIRNIRRFKEGVQVVRNH